MKTLTILILATLLMSCEKESTPIQSAKFTVNLTVDNQTGHPVTFKTATGQDDGQQYESLIGPDATFPAGISSQVFTSDADFDNIYFTWYIEDRSAQVWTIRNGELTFCGYGYNYTMQPDHNEVFITVLNK